MLTDESHPLFVPHTVCRSINITLIVFLSIAIKTVATLEKMSLSVSETSA